MQQLVNILPIDVVKYIIPYTYNTQNKTLLYDIQNYKRSKIKVFDLCCDYFTNNKTKENVILYTLFEYIYNTSDRLKFVQIFTRYVHLKTIYDVYNYVTNLQKKTINTQINIIWGLLTPEERNDIIIMFQKN
jgi:hypothetical protein